MPTLPIEHPIIAGLAFLSALPFGWPVIRAFARSAKDEVEEVVRDPAFYFLSWFPEWTIFMLLLPVVVLAALTVAFYKLYVLIGGLLGLVA